MWCLLVNRLIRVDTSLVSVPVVALAGLAGYSAADFVSGLAHWFCDTFFEEDTPLVGPLLIRPFREHHRDPAAMTEHGFLEMNGNTCLALALPLSVALIALPSTLASTVAAGTAAFVASLFAGLIATNRLHGWAHDPHAPALVQWLQRRRLILSPDRHARHHQAPYAQAYCVTHGWLNSLLDGSAFFVRATKLGMWLGVPRSER
jgi:ubiquitin-conjugating enzyme E2 variant